MPLQPIPAEICLMIFSNIFNFNLSEPFPCLSYFTSHYRLHHERRAQRLASFRCLAAVCKAWVDPARAAFWKEVTLFTMKELGAFALAVQDPSAKPTCIRKLDLRIKDQAEVHPSLDMEDVTTTVEQPLIVVFRQLPPHLDLLRVTVDSNLEPIPLIVYQGLEAVCRDHTLAIEVTTLDVTPLTIHDVFTYFTFSRNIVHLALKVTCNSQVFITPLPSLQLESLVLHMHFVGFDINLITVAAKDVTRVLRPACTTLLSLTLILYGYDRSPVPIRTRAMGQVLSLNGPSTSVLNLHLRAFSPMSIAQELADARAFPPFPMLLHLHLDEFGVFPDIFRQLGCSKLRKLEVTAMEEESWHDPRDGVETMGDVLDCMELRELDYLEDVVVDFGGVDKYYEQSWRRAVPWTDTESTWRPLEKACAARNINCVIRHPG